MYTQMTFVFLFFIMIITIYTFKNQKYIFSENYQNCIDVFNKSINKSYENNCRKQFKKNNLCSKLIQYGWNPNWKQSKLNSSNKNIKQIHKKIYNEFGNVTTSQIVQCFPNYI